MKKRYFLSDNSGAPIKIESLCIISEDIKHVWTYNTREEALKAFNHKAKVLNNNRYTVSWGQVVMIALAALGIDDLVRILVG